VSWEQKPLNEVADFCLGKMLDQNKNRGEALPYLANVNVRWGEFDFENLREMRFEPGEIDRYGLKYGDIVMCEGGEPGRCAVWRDQIPGMMIQKALHRIRPHSCLDSSFLFYSFLKKRKNDEFSGLFTGSTIKHLPKEKLAKVKVDVPPIAIQQRVVDILSAYDDLTENNRRRIALLEEAARMLYREWFVHFRFPSHEHVNIIGGIPEGWKIAGIEEAYEGLFDGPHATPSPSDEGPVFLGIQNIRETGGLDLSSIRHVSEADFPRWTRRVTPREGDLVFSYEATLNRYALIPRGLRCCLGRRMALIRPREKYREFLYLHMFSDSWRQVIAGRILVGATVDRIPLTTFPNFPILLPAQRIVAAFSETVEPQFKLIEALAEQNHKLAQARDLLLPRLMDGEIAV
jgi:type I restriction enzyme S subunit